MTGSQLRPRLVPRSNLPVGICLHCDKTNSEVEFVSARMCKPCRSEYAKQWRTANAEKVGGYHSRYRAERLPRGAHYAPGDSYKSIALRQCEKCAICKAAFSVNPDVDHDHETGIVRGLLCRRCNLLLGMANDSVELLASSIEYLTERGQ